MSLSLGGAIGGGSARERPMGPGPNDMSMSRVSVLTEVAVVMLDASNFFRAQLGGCQVSAGFCHDIYTHPEV